MSVTLVCRLASQPDSTAYQPCDKQWHHKPVVEEKDDDIERLRRMFAGVHEKREETSRLKKLMTRLRARKIRNGITKQKENDAA